jgi:hypothetical protein
MQGDDPLDTAALFGSRVIDATGRFLGRVIAIIHRADGCDVLVERRRWLRHSATRLDLDDLVERDGASYWYRPARRQATGGPGDDRVA